MLLLAEAAELISGNNQAYSVQPDIAGKSGPFISVVAGLWRYLVTKCFPLSPAQSPPARNMHVFVEGEDRACWRKY